MSKYDVIVSGGGLSGVAAAAAAAREGLSVLLVERYGFLGGMATAGMVNPFMDYSMPGGAKTQLNMGIFNEILSLLEDMGGLHKNRKTFNDVVMQLVLDSIIKKYGVEVLFHSTVQQVSVNGGELLSITAADKNDENVLEASYFIDATGDGDVAAKAGCKYEIGRQQDGFCQPMTLCFRIGGIDFDRLPSKDAQNKLYNEFQKKGLIKNTRENILIFPHTLDGVYHFNTTRVVKKSPENVWDMTAAELEAREQMYEMFTFLKENISGYENAQLLMSAAQIGVRESRRIMGHYVITEDDLVSCTKFSDSIARGNYCIDIHSPVGGGTHIRSIPDEDYYTIPYRAMLPLGKDNLIICGRPISATHEAHSAYRVMPICCNIGEAAGIAAALAKKSGIAFDRVNAAEIQAVLTQNGALY